MITTATLRKLLAAGGFFLLVLAAGGCKFRDYKRPAGLLNLGEVKTLLFEKQHIPVKAILLYRDERGWSALSTRSTYSGCDLTYQDQTLLDSCSGSEFSHSGKVLRGPADRPLPWYGLEYKDNRLFVDTGEIVDESYRFTTPEIEAAIRELREKIKTDDSSRGMKIPKILLGEGDETGSELEQFADELNDLSGSEVTRMTDQIVKPY